MARLLRMRAERVRFLDSLRRHAQNLRQKQGEKRMFKDLFSLEGRVALVTGGSRGIGKMIAAGFLSQGAAKVYITARKAGPCEATAKELTAEYGGECIALPIDISTMAGIDMLAAEIKKREAEARHSRQQCGRGVGRGVRRVSGKRLGQGDEPQPQDAVLSDQGAGGAAARRGLAPSSPPRSSTSPRSTASSSIRWRPIPTPPAKRG